MTTRRYRTALLAGWLLLASAASAENWAQWRGPFFNGSTTETGLPTKFSPAENVLWTADLPGVGGSTPIVWDGRIFITAQGQEGKKLWAVCLSRDDGKLLWKKPFGTGFDNRQGNTGASPSAITDGKTVWFLFGTGELAAFDFAGKELWRRNIAKDHGPFEILWDYGATGLLYGGRLYLPVIHGAHRGGESGAGKSFLLCVDPATGKDVWKHARPSKAPAEAKQAYTTPIPCELGGRKMVLVTGADHVTAHDPADGKELWRSPTYNPRKDKNYRTVVSPVVAAGLVAVCPPRGAEALYGVAVGGKGWAWQKRASSPDVCTPLYYRGKLFVLAGIRKKMLCLEPKTGKTIWEGDLGGKAVFQASPTGADGKIYCINLYGEAVVLSAGERFEVLHRASMGGKGCRATIVPAGGRLFLRTDTKLYCIGK